MNWPLGALFSDWSSGYAVGICVSLKWWNPGEQRWQYWIWMVSDCSAYGCVVVHEEDIETPQHAPVLFSYN